MANERTFLNRNIGTESAPIWERWFAYTVADAVLMSDADNETKNIKQYVNEQITALIGGAPEAGNTLKELYDLISNNKNMVDALNTAISDKAEKTHTHAEATTSTAGFMGSADKSKLNGIAAGANNYTHPTESGYKHIPTGGSSGQILRWSSAGTATWGTDNSTTYSKVTTTADGLMAKEDKLKLDGVESGANKYTHPVYTAKASGFYKTTIDNTGHVSAAGAVTKADITALGIPAQDTVYTHPTTHSPSIIASDATHRFVTDTEKSTWNSKATVYFAASLPASAPGGSICFLTE